MRILVKHFLAMTHFADDGVHAFVYNGTVHWHRMRDGSVMGISFEATLPEVIVGLKTQTTRPRQPHHVYRDGGVYGDANKPIYAPDMIVSATKRLAAHRNRGAETVYVQQVGSVLQVCSSADRAFLETQGLRGLRGKPRLNFMVAHGWQPLLIKYGKVDPVDVRDYDTADALREGCESLPHFWSIWIGLHSESIPVHDVASAYLASVNDEYTKLVRKLLKQRPARFYLGWRIQFQVVNTQEVSFS